LLKYWEQFKCTLLERTVNPEQLPIDYPSEAEQGRVERGRQPAPGCEGVPKFVRDDTHEDKHTQPSKNRG